MGCPHRLQAPLVLKGRCGLAARTAWLGSSFGDQRPLRAASPRRLQAASVLKGRPLPASPRRLASPHRSALFGSSFGAQTPLRAASPHRLQAALVLKGRCRRLPARTALQVPWCFKAAAGCQPAPLEAALVLKDRCGLPARTAPHSPALAKLALAGPCEVVFNSRTVQGADTWIDDLSMDATAKSPILAARNAVLGTSFGAQRPLRAASPLVLKGYCGLPARAAWKQLWCSKTAAGC